MLMGSNTLGIGRVQAPFSSAKRHGLLNTNEEKEMKIINILARSVFIGSAAIAFLLTALIAIVFTIMTGEEAVVYRVYRFF